MELTKEQVGRIDQYLKGKKVKYLDVRMELLDHLATEMEKTGSTRRDLTFSQLFNDIQKKYTNDVIQHIVAQRTEVIHDIWREKFNQFWAQFFTLPHILLTIGLTLFFWQFYGMEYGTKGASMLKVINNFIVLPGMILGIIYMTLEYFYKRRLLVMNYFSQMVWWPFAVANMSLYLEDMIGVSANDSLLLSIYMSFSAAIAVIGIYGCLFPFRKWLQKELVASYPLIKILG